MQVNQTSLLSKLRSNYTLLLFLTCTLLWSISFLLLMLLGAGGSPLESGSDSAPPFVSILFAQFVIAALFSGLSMGLYIFLNSKFGCYLIVGLGIIPPLIMAAFVWVAHWITLTIYTGDKESIPPVYRYISEKPKETTEQSPDAPQEKLDLPNPTSTISAPISHQQVAGPVTQSTQKTCPKCAEKIQLEALVCRYCGHQFNESEVADAQEESQVGIERDKANTDIREKQKATLIRIRELHKNVAKAKSKANAWILPLLFGGGIGAFACAFAAIALMFIVPMVSGNSEPTAIPGCSGLVVFLITWVGVTFWFRRSAKQRSGITVEDEEDTLKVAVEEIVKQYPGWISEIGGTEALLDLQKVKSLLATYTN